MIEPKEFYRKSDSLLSKINIVKAGEEFGIPLLKDTIVKNKDMNAEKILNAIFVAANKFGNKRKWNDDATVVVVKRNL